MSWGQLVMVALTAAGLAVGVFAGLAKLFLGQFERRIDGRLQKLDEDAAGWRKVEQRLMELRAELPEKYVRREDHVSALTVVQARLDALFSEVRLVQIRQGGTRE